MKVRAAVLGGVRKSYTVMTSPRPWPKDRLTAAGSVPCTEGFEWLKHL
jgi:hypothetical protein